MSKSISLAEDLYTKTAALAAKDRLSIDEFVSIMLANRLASREFIETHAMRFDRAEFDHALDRIPDAEPEGDDRL